MEISFEKWHGCKNDFAVVWISELDGDLVRDSLRRQTPALCDRHAGIGADGLLVLTTEKRGDLTPRRLTIINSDGSLAQTCGNGLRCAASSVLKAHRERGNPQDLPELVEFEVEGQVLSCRFMKKGATYPLVAVEMGVPTLSEELTWWGEARAQVARVAQELGVPELTGDLAACEIRNRHLVLPLAQASAALVRRVGPALQQATAWDGINVHLVKPQALTPQDQTRAGNELGGRLSELYQAFVWERGAGETMACGSGACAVGAVALASGLCERDQWVGVDMPGGRLYVRHDAPDEPVLLAGPATFVYQGRITI